MLRNVRTYVIKPFDPWKSRLCTCPPKFSFDPYTGCEHGCLYCYASSYIRNFYRCRPKQNLISKIRHDLKLLPKNSLISMSNSSDPYTPMESKLKLTRRCLEEFLGKDLRVLIITKSDLVVRDIDLLKKFKAAVTLTITTIEDELARKLEPNAPPPSRRIEALSKLSQEKIPVGVRVDPIIPFLNDDFKRLLKEIKNAGARHVTASTFKPRWDSWRRMEKAFPEVCRKLRPLYFEEGQRIGRSYYLPKSLRYRLMKSVAEECRKLKLTFATCREGFPELTDAKTCDGSHLIEFSLAENR